MCYKTALKKIRRLSIKMDVLTAVSSLMFSPLLFRVPLEEKREF